MPGHAGHRVHEDHERLAEVDLRGIGVHDRHAGHIGNLARARRVQFRINVPFEVHLDRIGVEVRAIVELDALAQVAASR